MTIKNLSTYQMKVILPLLSFFESNGDIEIIEVNLEDFEDSKNSKILHIETDREFNENLIDQAMDYYFFIEGLHHNCENKYQIMVDLS